MLFVRLERSKAVLESLKYWCCHESSKVILPEGVESSSIYSAGPAKSSHLSGCFTVWRCFLFVRRICLCVLAAVFFFTLALYTCSTTSVPCIIEIKNVEISLLIRRQRLSRRLLVHASSAYNNTGFKPLLFLKTWHGCVLYLVRTGTIFIYDRTIRWKYSYSLRWNPLHISFGITLGVVQSSRSQSLFLTSMPVVPVYC